MLVEINVDPSGFEPEPNHEKLTQELERHIIERCDVSEVIVTIEEHVGTGVYCENDDIQEDVERTLKNIDYSDWNIWD